MRCVVWAHDIVVFCPPEDMELARSVVRAGALAVVDAVPTWHDETARGAALFCKTVEDVETCTVSALVLDDVALLENRRVDVPVAVRIRSSEEALEAAKRGASAVILGPGGEGTLVVAQQLRGRIAIPWLIESTSGPAASAAARVIGASGVVLNWRTAGDRLADLRGYFRRLRTECRTSAERAAHQRLLAEGAPFARKFHARFPIVQGPMTRVSDGATFARAVGQSGGVPTIALGVSAAAEVRATLEEVSRTCAGPWGVGLLGFVEGELLVTQMAEVVAAKPSVAIVAGTNADAVLELESQGIAAFMHLPSPRLLATFVRAGVRRFVFEGNECGGHIGPLSSLDLWGAAVEAIRGLGASAGELDVLAAGGIHDAMTAAVAAAVFADAAELGATFGVLMGTAYLFTREAVSTGAITALYQTLALRCEHTVLLESGPGHVVRVADTAWAHEFRRERARLVDECAGAESLKQRLESLGLGRLRLAAKGFVRSDDEIAPASLELQERQGSFMMGAVATLAKNVVSIDELHHAVTSGAQDALEEASARTPALDVAVVGMSCVLPGAASMNEFWANVLANECHVREIPPSRWDTDSHYAATGGPWKTPSKWGGLIPEIEFEPAAYGIVPTSLESTDPAQILSLLVSDAALKDARLELSSAERQRTAVVFGIDGGGDIASALAAFVAEPGAARSRAPRWSEDLFPGILGNVVAGRVANRLDLGGPNYTVDAACASGLAAVRAACNELASGRVDYALAGAVDLHNALKDYLLFASVRALSPTGRCRTFDAAADGIVLGEGAGAVVLKRFDEAVRDGDRIYAVIRALGTSSDGRGASLTAPSPSGQLQCLRDAYARGRWRERVGLVEAHGTGTVVGDQVELAMLSEFFRQERRRPITVGSVKTQIGHTKCAAGIASFIKAALSVSRGVLPPQHGPESPPESETFVIRAKPAPWASAERVAGVSAFGFGGTNFHCVLSSATSMASIGEEWPCELFLLRGESPRDAWALADRLKIAAQGPRARLATLARLASDEARAAPIRYAFAASSIDELTQRLDAVPGLGVSGGGVHVARHGRTGDVAILFPGQGAQRVGMWAELLSEWPLWRAALESHEDVLARMFPQANRGADAREGEAALRETIHAQRALGVTALAVSTFLEELGCRAAFAAGHSYGELTALSHAGVIRRADVLRLSAVRAWAMAERSDAGGMLAVFAARDAVRTTLEGRADVWLANVNSPSEVIVAGRASALESLERALREQGVASRRLNVACAFHSPLMKAAEGIFEAVLAHLDCAASATRVMGADGSLYAADGSDARARLASQLTSPIDFVTQVRGLYDLGARTFVDVGPGTTLGELVRATLALHPHDVVTLDGGRGSLRGLLDGVAALAGSGVELDFGRILDRRGVAAPPSEAAVRPSWVVDGAGCRRKTDPDATPVREPAHALVPPPLESVPYPASRDEVACPDTKEEAMQSDKNELLRLYLENVRALATEQHDVVLRALGSDIPVRASRPTASHVEPALLRGPVEPPRVKGTNGANAVNPSNDGVTASAGVATSTNGNGRHPIRLAAELLPSGAPPSPVSALAMLKQLVARETGYTEDLLGDDTDLESDLGIDSIKRLEILVTACEWVRVELAHGSAAARQVARGFRTLGAMAEWLEKKKLPEIARPVSAV